MTINEVLSVPQFNQRSIAEIISIVEAGSYELAIMLELEAPQCAI